QAEDGIRDFHVTGVQTCALPIFSVDQMPRSFTGVFQWMMAITGKVFGTHARSGVPVDDQSEDMQLMSDSRFVLAAFCTPKGQAEIGRASCRERVKIAAGW